LRADRGGGVKPPPQGRYPHGSVYGDEPPDTAFPGYRKHCPRREGEGGGRAGWGYIESGEQNIRHGLEEKCREVRGKPRKARYLVAKEQKRKTMAKIVKAEKARGIFRR